MGASGLAITVVTLFWLFVGIAGPIVMPKSPNRLLFQVCLISTSICCYLLWLIVYMAQMNPLFGPAISNLTVIAAKDWSRGYQE